ncbi:MAG TPA: hypothetical protein VFA51_01000 [Candidatus Udaeobacter sp.]|nr:hypothetical protein [Candidatus Udaeobacter sp.]
MSDIVEEQHKAMNKTTKRAILKTKLVLAFILWLLFGVIFVSAIGSMLRSVLGLVLNPSWNSLFYYLFATAVAIFSGFVIYFGWRDLKAAVKQISEL